jgi:uncharacterized protein (DUF305 family)
VFALIAVGLGVLWWMSLSERPPAEGTPSVNFARDMAAHHRQAVEMTLIVRDRTQDPALRQLLIDQILTQQAQIGYFEGWLTTWGLPLAGPQPPMTGMMRHEGSEMQMTPELMGMQPQSTVNKLGTLPVAEAEIQFLQMMIAHHKGGVLMSQSVLAENPRPEVARLAESIINGQTAEIDYMQTLLQVRGVTP